MTTLYEYPGLFSNSIKLIDKSKLTIEIANVDVAKTLRTKMPDANVIYNAVYFKRIVKSTMNSNEKTILIAIYNNQNQRRYIGVKLD